MVIIVLRTKNILINIIGYSETIYCNRRKIIDKVEKFSIKKLHKKQL